jgi:DNA-binding IclR family transcriptional regulator
MFHEETTPRPPRTTNKLAKLSGAARVLEALKAVARHPRGAALDQLARELGAPKSSMHRALAALRNARLVDHDAGGSYRLGLEFLRLAFEHYDQLDERAMVEPILQELSTRFGETSHYAKLEGGEIVYVAKVSPPTQRIQMTSTVGGRNPAHCTAVGKALMACELTDLAGARRFVKAHGPLVRRTAHTITNAAQLARELEQIREVGYALDREESEIGIHCVALPIFIGSHKRPTGALSVSAIAARTPMNKLLEVVPEMRRLVRERLGNVLPG